MKKSEVRPSKYSHYLGVWVTKEIKEGLDKYASNEGVKIPVVVRKSIIKYLKEKGALDADKQYL